MQYTFRQLDFLLLIKLEQHFCSLVWGKSSLEMLSTLATTLNGTEFLDTDTQNLLIVADLIIHIIYLNKTSKVG